MTKKELVEILKKLDVPISESSPKDEDMESDVRICFWDYIWEPLVASDTEYNTKATYQISFISNIPRHPKLLKLKEELNKKEIFPTIQHERLTEERRIHSFFSIEVLENIG